MSQYKVTVLHEKKVLYCYFEKKMIRFGELDHVYFLVFVSPKIMTFFS